MIGKLIKDRRKDLELTQKELASRVEVAQTTVSKWESDTDEPTGKNLNALARELDVKRYYFTSRIESDDSFLQGLGLNKASEGTLYEPFSTEEVPLLDRENAANRLKGNSYNIIKSVWRITIPGEMSPSKVFALQEDMDGMAPAINIDDQVFIKPELAIKPGSYSMFWVNDIPLIGKVMLSPTGMTLNFLASTPGWESVVVTTDDYIGRVIAIDPFWAMVSRQL